MQNRQFTYFAAENFLCFGAKPVEIDLTKLGRIVVVKGENLDTNPKNADGDSNGAGKSSVPEIPIYTLFGKTIRRPKKLGHGEVINFKTGKKLRTETRWDKYRVVRTRKPDTLRVWESEDGVWDKSTEITRGGIPATQELIHEILGLTYETFVNVSVFSDDNSMSFLELDGPAKREIVENLLSLDKYRAYAENVKTLRNTTKNAVKLLSTEYSRLLSDTDGAKFRLDTVIEKEKNWRLVKTQEVEAIALQIAAKRKELLKTDYGAEMTLYEQAQAKIKELEDADTALVAERTQVETAGDDLRTKQNELNTTVENLLSKKSVKAGELAACQAEIARAQDTLDAAKNRVPGTKCPTCYQTLEESSIDHVVAEAEGVIASATKREEEFKLAVAELQTKLTKAGQIRDRLAAVLAENRAKVKEIDQAIAANQKEVTKLSHVKEPQPDAAQVALQEQIKVLEASAEAKKAEAAGETPYREVIESQRKELEDKKAATLAKKKELQEAEEELPYLEYWVKGFGDEGIRQFVIAGIVPALNSRVQYWMQFLVDNKIKLTFDPTLKETIDRWPFNNRPYVYHGLSGGQRRRCNLAVSQSFAHVMTLNTGTCPSVVFLDEVTMNMDRAGVEGIYRMICELSKDRQVFVIDHNEALLQMLSGCQSLTLRMKDEVTSLVA